MGNRNEDKLREKYNEARELSYAFRDLEAAWDYAEILLKYGYHGADPGTYHPRPRSEKDVRIREALVTSLVLSLSRAHKYCEECLSSEEDRRFAKRIKYLRDKYETHSDICNVDLSSGPEVFYLDCWDKNDTEQARSLIKKTFQHLRKITGKITPDMTEGCKRWNVEHVTFSEMPKLLDKLNQEGTEILGMSRELDEDKKEWFYRVIFNTSHRFL